MDYGSWLKISFLLSKSLTEFGNLCMERQVLQTNMKHPQTPWAKMHTCHFSFEELDEGLGERKNPFIHDVIALLNCVLIVKEFSSLILSSKHKADFQVIRVYNQTSVSNYLSASTILASSLGYTEFPSSKH